MWSPNSLTQILKHQTQNFKKVGVGLHRQYTYKPRLLTSPSHSLFPNHRKPSVYKLSPVYSIRYVFIRWGYYFNFKLYGKHVSECTCRNDVGIRERRKSRLFHAFACKLDSSHWNCEVGKNESSVCRCSQKKSGN